MVRPTDDLAPVSTKRELYEIGTLETLYDLESALRKYPDLSLRYSAGPMADALPHRIDPESGLEIPGLPVEPLQPEHWWHRPISDWLARQLYSHRGGDAQEPRRFAWVLIGRMAGRGPDCKPLIADVLPIARLAGALIDEAVDRYRERFPPPVHTAIR